MSFERYRGHTETVPLPLRAGYQLNVSMPLKQPGSQGKTYELGGPRVYSYRSLVRLVLDQTEQQRLLLPLPFPIWNFLAAVASTLPNPSLTGTQVMLMKRDNVVAKTALSLKDLGVNPTALEDILPEYGF